MLVEGRGNVIPAAVSVHLTVGDVEMLRLIAERRDRFRRYQQRSDKWGRGYTHHPTFVGLAGELAVATYINARLGVHLSIDDRLLANGDGGRDFEVDGLIVQVKTIRNGNCNLVRRLDAQKRLLPPPSPDAIYLFAKWWPSVRRVDLKGWIVARDASSLATFERSRVDVHWNLHIDDRQLISMNRLLSEIRLRRAS